MSSALAVLSNNTDLTAVSTATNKAVYLRASAVTQSVSATSNIAGTISNWFSAAKKLLPSPIQKLCNSVSGIIQDAMKAADEATLVPESTEAAHTPHTETHLPHASHTISLPTEQRTATKTTHQRELQPTVPTVEVSPSGATITRSFDDIGLEVGAGEVTEIKIDGEVPTDLVTFSINKITQGPTFPQSYFFPDGSDFMALPHFTHDGYQIIMGGRNKFVISDPSYNPIFNAELPPLSGFQYYPKGLFYNANATTGHYLIQYSGFANLYRFNTTDKNFEIIHSDDASSGHELDEFIDAIQTGPDSYASLHKVFYSHPPEGGTLYSSVLNLYDIPSNTKQTITLENVLPSGQQVKNLYYQNDQFIVVKSVSFNPDLVSIFSLSQTNNSTKTNEFSTEGHVEDIKANTQNYYIYEGGSSKSIRVYDLHTGNVLDNIATQSSPVFVTDKNELLSGNLGQTFSVYDVNTFSLKSSFPSSLLVSGFKPFGNQLYVTQITGTTSFTKSGQNWGDAVSIRLSEKYTREIMSPSGKNTVTVSKSSGPNSSFDITLQASPAVFPAINTPSFSEQVGNNKTVYLNSALITDADNRWWQVGSSLPFGASVHSSKISTDNTDLGIARYPTFFTYPELMTSGYLYDISSKASSSNAGSDGYLMHYNPNANRFYRLKSESETIGELGEYYLNIGQVNTTSDDIYTITSRIPFLSAVNVFPAPNAQYFPNYNILGFQISIRKLGSATRNIWTTFNLTNPDEPTWISNIEGDDTNNLGRGNIIVQNNTGNPFYVSQDGVMSDFSHRNFSNPLPVASRELTGIDAVQTQLLPDAKAIFAATDAGLEVLHFGKVAVGQPIPERVNFFPTANPCAGFEINDARNIIVVADTLGKIYINQFVQFATDTFEHRPLYEVDLGVNFDARLGLQVFFHDNGECFIVDLAEDRLFTLTHPTNNWFDSVAVNIEVTAVGQRQVNIPFSDFRNVNGVLEALGRSVDIPVNVEGLPSPVQELSTLPTYATRADNGQILLNYADLLSSGVIPKFKTGTSGAQIQIHPDVIRVGDIFEGFELDLSTLFNSQNGAQLRVSVSQSTATTGFDILDAGNGKVRIVAANRATISQGIANHFSNGAPTDNYVQTVIAVADGIIGDDQLGSMVFFRLNLPIVNRKPSFDARFEARPILDTGFSGTVELPPVQDGLDPVTGNPTQLDGDNLAWSLQNSPTPPIWMNSANVGFGATVPLNSVGTYHARACVLDPIETGDCLDFTVTNAGKAFSQTGTFTDSRLETWVGIEKIFHLRPQSEVFQYTDGDYADQTQLIWDASAPNHSPLAGVNFLPLETTFNLTATAPGDIVVRTTATQPSFFKSTNTGGPDSKTVTTSITVKSSINAVVPNDIGFVEGVSKNFDITITTPGTSIDFRLTFNPTSGGVSTSAFVIDYPAGLEAYIDPAETFSNQVSFKNVPKSVLTQIGTASNGASIYTITMGATIPANLSPSWSSTIEVQDYKTDGSTLNNRYTAGVTHQITQVDEDASISRAYTTGLARAPITANEEQRFDVVNAISDPDSIITRAAIFHSAGTEVKHEFPDEPETSLDYLRFIFTATQPGRPEIKVCAVKSSVDDTVPTINPMSEYEALAPRLNCRPNEEITVTKPVENSSGDDQTTIISSVVPVAGVGTIIIVAIAILSGIRKCQRNSSYALLDSIVSKAFWEKLISVSKEPNFPDIDSTEFQSLAASQASTSSASEVAVDMMHAERGFGNLDPAHAMLLPDIAGTTDQLTQVYELVYNRLIAFGSRDFKNGTAFAHSVLLFKIGIKLFNRKSFMDDLAATPKNLLTLLQTLLNNLVITKGRSDIVMTQRLVSAFLITALIATTRKKSEEKELDIRHLPGDTRKKFLDLIDSHKDILSGKVIGGNPWEVVLLTLIRSPFQTIPIDQSLWQLTKQMLGTALTTVKNVCRVRRHRGNELKTKLVIDAAIALVKVFGEPDKAIMMSRTLGNSKSWTLSAASVIILNYVAESRYRPTDDTDVHHGVPENSQDLAIKSLNDAVDKDIIKTCCQSYCCCCSTEKALRPGAMAESRLKSIASRYFNGDSKFSTLNQSSVRILSIYRPTTEITPNTECLRAPTTTQGAPSNLHGNGESKQTPPPSPVTEGTRLRIRTTGLGLDRTDSFFFDPGTPRSHRSLASNASTRSRSSSNGSDSGRSDMSSDSSRLSRAMELGHRRGGAGRGRSMRPVTVHSLRGGKLPSTRTTTPMFSQESSRPGTAAHPCSPPQPPRRKSSRFTFENPLEVAKRRQQQGAENSIL